MKANIRLFTNNFIHPEHLEDKYPDVSEWAKGSGWIEIGYDDYSRSFVRLMDIGGMVWEGDERYESMDAMFKALEAAIRVWVEENLSGSEN